jgi:uncharacterized protein YbgA (DUF1722 family)/uncharacterized protein YbbK (DUF523 family)
MTTVDPPIRLGISTCLLGERVRFDGGHKHDRFLTDVLGRYVEWVPVCPEVEVGMGIPRESVRLAGDPAAPRMVGVKTGTDHTAAMRRFASARVRQLAALDLCGYVFKKDSPSCGMERVRVYAGSGTPSRQGQGLFAAAYRSAFPLIPVEEEGRLNDPALRENFIERIFCYRRWRDLTRTGLRRRALVDFHTRHKFLLLAHSPRLYQELGRLVAGQERVSPARLAERYGGLFMEALGAPATVAKHANVLNHIAGYCRRHLGPPERQELAGVIEDYRRKIVPLIVPITLLHHHVYRNDIEYVKGQWYLSPHPKELMLRNHV